MLSAVAKKVHETVMTSSPAPIPSARSARTIASVPFPHETPYLAPSYAANSSSKAVTSAPPIYPPLRSTFSAASSYSAAYVSCCRCTFINLILTIFSPRHLYIFDLRSSQLPPNHIYRHQQAHFQNKSSRKYGHSSAFQ